MLSASHFTNKIFKIFLHIFYPTFIYYYLLFQHSGCFYNINCIIKINNTFKNITLISIMIRFLELLRVYLEVDKVLIQVWKGFNELNVTFFFDIV